MSISTFFDLCREHGDIEEFKAFLNAEFFGQLVQGIEEAKAYLTAQQDSLKEIVHVWVEMEVTTPLQIPFYLLVHDQQEEKAKLLADALLGFQGFQAVRELEYVKGLFYTHEHIEDLCDMREPEDIVAEYAVREALQAQPQ